MNKKFAYVDSFVIPVPRKNLPQYRKWVRALGKVLRENGVLDYFECVADDAKAGDRTSFPQAVKLKKGEVVVLAIVTYKSRAHRDRTLKNTMSDPRLARFMDPSNMIFDGMRMFFGGFKPFQVYGK